MFDPKLLEEAATASREILATTDGSRMFYLVDQSLVRLIIADAQAGRDWRKIISQQEQRNVLAWIRTAIANDEEWTRDLLTSANRMRAIPTLSDLVTEATKANLIQRIWRAKLVGRNESLFYKDEKTNLFFVRLHNEDALIRECATMQHRMEKTPNDVALSYLSLRDASGRRHATIEFVGRKVAQVLGAHRRPIEGRCLDAAIRYIDERNLKCVAPLAHLNRIMNKDGVWLDGSNLQPGTVTLGDLDMVDSTLKSLPEHLTVTGDLRVKGCSLVDLPDHLTVNQSLDLRGTHFPRLPDHLKVRWTLNIEATNFEVMPEGLKVGDLLAKGSSLAKYPLGLMAKIRGEVYR
ncbi:hypothetical protein [Rhizobium sp. NXC24]|uniref:hypothetical protein n=1 Tax=Rhizobium sp. NXC24 TaxID=2048897 RepID=UPI000CDF44F6|nr:hypothetical protein [Rhizobium sp. NXC24]AVA21287.1 hypothetical protein NXC24_CH01636 [Rhizobium sp. NXC24]